MRFNYFIYLIEQAYFESAKAIFSRNYIFTFNMAHIQRKLSDQKKNKINATMAAGRSISAWGGFLF